MKKALVYLFTIVLGASIPIYFLLFWEPLKSDEVLSSNAISNITDEESDVNGNEELVNNSVESEVFLLRQKDTSNSLLNYIDSDRNEKLDSLMKKLSTLDLIKINDYFSNKDDIDRIRRGFELAKKRMSVSDYEVFKNILENYVDSSVFE
ncbi:hypothetical protein R0131_12275 [Clostridium sp. AL.422]|uniref:hypothetical protein n=1 Tax=Clostridium TaxID=1485 RepID=UPI00293DAF81|nr:MULTISPECIES: hypothetical protein [unclassified Clostridium]MDV4151606.1 hypothetical protein [Clostridium sp. AL.422]